MRHPGLRNAVGKFFLRLFLCLLLIDVLVVGYGISIMIKKILNL